jgi:hypothetical protein
MAYARCAFQRRLPMQYHYMGLFNYKYGPASPPPSLFPSVLRQPATHLLTQPSFHFLSAFEDHLLLSHRFSALRHCRQSLAFVLTSAGGLLSLPVRHEREGMLFDSE